MRTSTTLGTSPLNSSGSLVSTSTLGLFTPLPATSLTLFWAMLWTVPTGA